MKNFQYDQEKSKIVYQLTYSIANAVSDTTIKHIIQLINNI